MDFQYSSITKLIEVKVSPNYLEEQSIPHRSCYIWIYNITIENKSSSSVQLLNRIWQIVDLSGITNEIVGPGVIGKQPILKPGEIFSYTSGAYLSSPAGIMQGQYQFINESESRVFYVKIPTFFLESPYVNTRQH